MATIVGSTDSDSATIAVTNALYKQSASTRKLITVAYSGQSASIFLVDDEIVELVNALLEPH